MARNRPTSPPAAQLVLRVGVTGHGPNRLAQMPVNEALLRTKIRQVLELLRDAVQDVHAALGSASAPCPPVMRLISPLAEGAEHIVAQEALDIGFELQCPLPFDREEYAKDFETAESLKAYREMLDKATAVLELDGSRENSRREQAAYEAVRRMVLKQCDVLIAIWDGKEPEGKGDTGQIVEEAARLKIPTVWIQSYPPHATCLRVCGKDGMIQEAGLHRLPGKLGELLLPPSPPHPDLRKAYFLETPRQWTLGFLFKAFRDLITDGKLGRLEWRPPEFESASEGEWRQAWQAAPGFPEAVVEHINSRFRTHYAWADKLAEYYANLYRSSFTAIYLMGAIAVLFALLAHVHEEKWIWLELVFILLITTIALLGTHRRWHERWIDYRLLAEQLRQMRFLAPLGLTSPFNEQRDSHRTWASWHFRAIVRAAGMVNTRIDSSYLDTYRKLLAEYEIQTQIAYHRENACRSHVIHHRLHWSGVVLFLLTFAVCVFHLLGGFYPRIPNPWLTLCAAVLPAFGAAAYAIRSHGEFQRIAERSAAMSEKLIRLKEKADQLPSAHLVPSSLMLSHALGQIAEDAAETMIAEVVDWRILFRDKPLELPG